MSFSVLFFARYYQIVREHVTCDVIFVILEIVIIGAKVFAFVAILSKQLFHEAAHSLCN